MKVLRKCEEEMILELLKQPGSAMSVDEISEELYKQDQLSERVVKETILRLREKGKIKPNREWKMESAS
jgi:predicted transcriptional regulator